VIPILPVTTFVNIVERELILEGSLEDGRVPILLLVVAVAAVVLGALVVCLGNRFLLEGSRLDLIQVVYVTLAVNSFRVLVVRDLL
jgi:hypothetical protein